MAINFVRTAISNDLESHIKEMQEKIKQIFSLELNRIQITKIIAWKSKNYKTIINEKKLIEILGGKI